MNKYTLLSDFVKEDISDDLLNINIDDFPIEVFPKEIQDLFINLDDKLDFHPDILSIAYLSVVSTLIGNSIKLKVNNQWISSATLWFCAVGKSATKKSPPIKLLYRPLRKIDENNFNEYKLKLKEYREYQEENAGKPKNERSKEVVHKPRFYQHIVTDATMESLYQVWENNSKGLVMYREELKGWLLSMNSYRRGSDEQTWLEFHDNTDTVINRVTKEPMLIIDPAINVIGAIQPNIINDFSSDNGMMQRILFTKEITRITPMTEHDISEDELKLYNYHVMSMYKTLNRVQDYDMFNEYVYDGKIIIKITEDGLKKFVEFDNEFLTPMILSDSTPDITKSYIGKMKTYLPRIALVLYVSHCCMNGFVEFNYTFIEKSIKVIRYFINSNISLMHKNQKMKELNNFQFKNKSTKEICREYKEKGISVPDISSKLGISKAAVYKHLKNN